MRIILASASPRRRELLGQIGLAFEVKVSEVEERISTTLPEQVVEELSVQKAEAVLWAVDNDTGAGSGRTECGSRNGPEAARECVEDVSDSTAGMRKDSREAVLIIGADTVVSMEGRILGKPSDAQEACRMIAMLSGKTHAVYTGVTLLYCPEGGSIEAMQRKTFHEKTEVTFYPMTEAEISAYVASGDSLDKAGAYGIQGPFARYVRNINGDYNNVVGLPVGRLYQEAKEWLE